MANTFRRIRVTNIQQYPIGRGRHVFPPRSTVEVLAKEGSQIAEINSSVYLRVEDLGGYDIADGGVETAPQMIDKDVDPSRTVYTGLNGETDTHYTGLDDGERETESDEPLNPDVVRSVSYEEQTVQELTALAQERGIELPDEATKEMLVDLLSGGDSNANVRPDTSDVQVDPTNVAEETGMVTTEGDHTDVQPAAEQLGYNAMTVPELRTLAKERGVDVKSDAKKQDIISALEA